MGFTTTCRVGVDLETITVLFQSTVTSFGLLTDWASTEPEKMVAGNKRRERALNRWIKLLSATIESVSHTGANWAGRFHPPNHGPWFWTGPGKWASSTTRESSHPQ